MECDRQSLACQVERIADATSSFDWNSFLSTLIATILGALVAALVGLLVARSERPQPFFRVEALPPGGQWFRDADGFVQIEIQLSNIGDGPAYNVHLRATPSSSNWVPEVAKLDPGDSLKGAIKVQGHGTYDMNPLIGLYEDSRSVDWPANAAAIVAWQQPPKRSKVRHQRISLSSPFKAKD